MAKTARKRALVIGGSMSGLLAGLMLRRAGWQVDVHERVASELSGRGAGIVAQPELIEKLRGVGLDPTDLGVHITMRKIIDAKGDLVVEMDCPQVLTAWERAYRMLRDGFPPAHYHRGRAFQSFTQDAQGVTALFADGSTETADLLVGADGIRSNVRAQFLPDLTPLYAGYVAWRSLIDEDAMSPGTRRDIFGTMTFGLPPGEQFLGYPVAGPDNDLRPGHRRYNVIWYRPADEQTQLKDLLTDAKGVTHAISIPPPLIRREFIDGLRDAADRQLAPQFREIVRMMDEPILQPIYDLETPKMAFGRVAIIGDAAFVARPHVGAGVAKAADDAAALAAALVQAPDVESGLLLFEAERLPVGRQIIQYARRLGAYLQAQQTAEEQALSARHSIPQAVLQETALLDFLHR